MDELVARIAKNQGIDPAIVRQAVGIILKFLLSEGPREKVQALVDVFPGAADAVAAAPDVGGGVMGVFNSLTAVGLGMGEVQGVTQDFVEFCNEKIGTDAVREIVGAIPGLNQFV